MYSYICPGCRRRCSGTRGICLDCEFLLEAVKRQGYRVGADHGLEYGLAHPTELSSRGIHTIPVPRATPEVLTTVTRLPHEDELRIFQQGFEYGFRRGLNQALVQRNYFSKKCLREYLHAVGRRQGMLYCIARLTRSPDPLLDVEVFRVIRSFTTSPETSRINPSCSTTADTADGDTHSSPIDN